MQASWPTVTRAPCSPLRCSSYSEFQLHLHSSPSAVCETLHMQYSFEHIKKHVNEIGIVISIALLKKLRLKDAK